MPRLENNGWSRVLVLILSIGAILLCGSAEDGGSPSGSCPGDLTAGDSQRVDEAFIVPGASALPEEARENVVGPVPGPGVDYTSIQEAIDNSTSGDVVYVRSGTYNETLTVKTPGIALHGVDTGDGKPVVSGDGVESTVTLSADGCELEGFVIMNSGNPHAGVSVTSSNNTIVGNIMTNNRGFGLHLNRSSYNQISSNGVNNSGFDGIYLENSSFNNLSFNNASYNQLNGIKLQSSTFNTILDNSASFNGENGMVFIDSDDNFVDGNVLCNNTHQSISIQNSAGTAIEEKVDIDVARVSEDNGSETKTISADLSSTYSDSGETTEGEHEFSWWF